MGHDPDRLRIDPPSRAYIQRRTTHGKTTKEIMRLLKRYLARELYPLLKPTSTTPNRSTSTAAANASPVSVHGHRQGDPR